MTSTVTDQLRRAVVAPDLSPDDGETRALLQDALIEIETLRRQVSDLREVKDGYYESMARWRQLARDAGRELPSPSEE